MLSKLVRVPAVSCSPGVRCLFTSGGNSARYSGFKRATPGYGVGMAAKQGTATIRERLLGPTTGKPFIYGTYAIAGASAAGIGMLCYYGLGLSGETAARDKIGIWPQYVRDRMTWTYGYLGGSLTATAASAMAVARSPRMLALVSRNGILGLVATIGAVVGTGILCRSIDYGDASGLKHAAWLLHCATLGAILAPMCIMGGPLLIRAAWYTAGLAAGLSTTAMCAPSERFLNWSGPLAMGLGVVFVSSMGTWFLPPTTALGAGLASIAIYGGLILFGAFLLYDTQRVIKRAEDHPPPGYGYKQFDPINAQLGIYIDILNIFIRIAMIMGMQGGRRK